MRPSLIATLLLGMLLSCSEQLDLSNVPLPTEVAAAQRWFELNATLQQTADASGRGYNPRSPQWEKGRYDKEQKMIVVPLTFERELVIKPAASEKPGSFQKYLVLRELGSGDYLTRIAFVIPDSRNSAAPGKQKNFSGTVVYYDWDQTFQEGYIFSDGELAGSLRKLKTSQSGKMALICKTITYDYYVNNCSLNRTTGQMDCILIYDYSESYSVCTYMDDGLNTTDSSLPYGVASSFEGSSDFDNGVFVSDEELVQFQKDYRTMMTEAELALFNKLSPADQLIYLACAKLAMDLAAYHFPGDLHNGKGDAFRHAMFAALLSHYFGTEMAKIFGDAHENFAGNSPIEKTMDLYNNMIGRSIGSTPSPYSNYYTDQLAKQVIDAIVSGKLREIENGKLVPTNATALQR